MCRARDMHALRCKIAVEQGFAIEGMNPHGRAQRVIEAVDRIERETWLAAAKDDRRDDHMQAIEAASLEKPQDGVGAPFDQHAPQSGLGEAGEDRRWRDMPIDRRQSEIFDVAKRARRAMRRHDKAANAIVGEQAGLWRESPARIYDDARWRRSGDVPDGQSRIVCERAANADDDGVDQGAKPMKMRESGRAVDVM